MTTEKTSTQTPLFPTIILSSACLMWIVHVSCAHLRAVCKMFHVFHVFSPLWNTIVEHDLPSIYAGYVHINVPMFQCSTIVRLYKLN